MKNTIIYKEDQASGIQYRKIVEKTEIVRATPAEPANREREGFRNVLKIFADTMSEITGEPVRPGDVVGVMYSAMNAAEVPKDQRLEEYRKSLYLYQSERRALYFYECTKKDLDRLVAVVAEDEQGDY